MPTIYQFDELSLEGMEIGAISLTAERLSCDFGSGYGESAVVGHTSGLWGWDISSDCLPDDDAYLNEINGKPRAQYYFDFYLEHTLGDQDVFEIEFRNRKYHASFAENSISGEMLTYDIFSLAGVRLKQRRVPGIYYRSDGSVFHPEELIDSFFGWYGSNGDDQFFQDATGVWDLVPNGNITTSTYNSLPIVQLNVGATNTGYYNAPPSGPVIKHAFFVMKMRETTFSNFAGILTAATGTAMVTGDSGTTKFYNQAAGTLYRKNGVDFLESNQQAPMNVWALCHWKNTAGIGLTDFQIGKDRNFAGRFAEMDIGEVILCDTLLSSTDAADLENYLMNRWGL